MKQLIRLDNRELTPEEARFVIKDKAFRRPIPIGLNPTASKPAVALYRRRMRREMKKERRT